GHRDPVDLSPDHRDPRAVRRIAVEAVGEITATIDRDGLFRLAAGMRTRKREVAGTGPVEDAGQRRRPLLPVQAEFHPMVVELRFVLRVDLAAAAVFRGSIDGPEQLPVERPDADALGLEIVLRDPEL